MGEGITFSLLVCPRGGGVPQGTYPLPRLKYLPLPGQVRTGGGGTIPSQGTHPSWARSGCGEGVPQGIYSPWPRYLPPGQVMRGRGYPKVPTPWPRHLHPLGQVRMGEGMGYSKVPTPWPRYLPLSQGIYPLGQVRVGGGGIPRYLPPPPAKVPTPSPSQGLPTRRVVCLLRSRRRTFLFL